MGACARIGKQMEDIEEVQFNKIKMPITDKLLKDCDLVYQGQYDNLRLYIDKQDKGFQAMAVVFNSSDGDAVPWESDSFIVDVVFTLSNCLDGARHLHVASDNDGYGGYLYYPNMKDLAAMFSILRELELKLCGQADKLEEGYDFESKSTLKAILE